MLSVRIDAINLKFNPGVNMSAGLQKQYLDNFATYLSNVIKNELVRAIDTQRFNYKWRPLSVEYLEYKKSHGLSTKVWEATGLLKDSLQVYRDGKCIVVGVDRKKKYNNGELVYKVIHDMEYGTSRIPPRPLFRPLVSFIRKHVRKYWEDYLGGIM